MRGATKAEQTGCQSLNTKKSGRRNGFDPLPSEGRIYQKNEGGWNFRLSESDCKSKVLLDIPVGRYMDISLIDIDIQPTWVRILVKGKLLQLLLPEEVNPDTSVAQRSSVTGNLLISMPKASCNCRINVRNIKTTALFYSEEPKKLIRAHVKTDDKSGGAVNTDKSTNSVVETAVKELQNASNRTCKDLTGKQALETELVDDRNYDDLPALE